MLSKYLTTLEKIYYKLFIKFHKIEGCFYKHKAIDKSKRIVLYLDYPKFIHLGDTLWCEPVARLIAANFNLAICCTSQMEFYFKRLGYKVINKSLIGHDDLLVARTELAYHLRNRDVLWINFDYTKVFQPIINVVLNNIAGYLGLNLIDAKPRTLNFGPAEKSFVALKFEIASGDKYAVLNNYIDSHKYGMNSGELLEADKAVLQFATKHKKDAGVKLVHVGTKREKEHDPNHYEIVDLDLRGLTSVEEAFILASLDNVINYIGFDAFWLHLFNMYNKGSYIMLKPGFPEMYNRQVRNYVAIPYAGEKNKVTFISENISMKFSNERANNKFRFLDRYIGIPIIFLLGLLKKRNKILLDSIKKVAFLKTAGIGDTVLLSAVVKDFKDAYPSAWLTVFVASNNYEMAQLISGIDTIIKLPMANPLQCIHRIKESGKYDIWIDFGPWPRINALLSYFSNTRLKVGFKTKGQYRHYIYDVTAEHSAQMHELDNYKNLLKKIGLDCNNLPCIDVQIPEYMNNRITIHMFPGGSRSYLKQWPDANWIEIIDQLTAHHYEVFLTGAKIDREKAEQIKTQIKNRGSVTIVAGALDLKQTAELLKSSALVISVDTGIMHLASALGCNLIALHGPTSVKRWGSLNANAISLQSGLQCSPCINLGFESKCQINSCMKAITTEALMDAIKKCVHLNYPYTISRSKDSEVM